MRLYLYNLHYNLQFKRMKRKCEMEKRNEELEILAADMYVL